MSVRSRFSFRQSGLASGCGGVERRAELGMLILVALITVAGYILVGLSQTVSLPIGVLPFLGLVVGLLGVAHIVTRWAAPRATPVLLPLAAVLNGLGYVIIARLNHHLAGLQATWTAVGITAYVVTLVVVRNPRDLQLNRYTIAAVGLGLLMLPLIPGLGVTINGARLWVRLGPLTFQPVELAKIALAVFFAAYLVERRDVLSRGTRRLGPLHLPSARHLGPILGVWALSLLIMTAERDIGFSLLIFTAFLTMVWLVTGRSAYLIGGSLLSVAGVVGASRLFVHVHDRIVTWLNPWPVANSKGYQLIQGLFAFGAGGVAGTGLGQGSPQRIPVVASDFIFAASAKNSAWRGPPQ
jgi:peptidoglycan glycosyltransferase